jgi:phage recombination protein Bet
MTQEDTMSAVAIRDPAGTPRGLSIIASMAENYGMRADAFEATLRATVVPKQCTREEFAAFILVAKAYELNPILKEIYAIPKKGGGIQPIVGVDGWYNIMNKHPQFDALDFEDHLDGAGNVTAITCRVYRKDRTRPICVTEYMVECRQGTEPWQKWPRRMLRHKAAIQAARVAFGFSGIVDPDEADRFTRVDRAGQPVASIHAQATRQLQTIDAHPDEFGPSEDFAAEPPPPAAETPADPASSSSPLDDAGDNSEAAPALSPIEEATQAGRYAARTGIGYEAVSPKYAKYKAWARAWQEGHAAEGERMEAEARQ